MQLYKKGTSSAYNIRENKPAFKTWIMM